MFKRLGYPPRSGRRFIPAVAYNLLVTRRWMLLVPRSAEHFGSVSLNALAFAGNLLLRDEQQMAELKGRGPMAALRCVGLPGSDAA
jgi:ATP adenylyltransferase